MRQAWPQAPAASAEQRQAEVGQGGTGHHAQSLEQRWGLICLSRKTLETGPSRLLATMRSLGLPSEAQ